ncbi:Pyrophosphate-energized vacuolar membrane proton pump 1 [Bienertia sinuspersici]
MRLRSQLRSMTVVLWWSTTVNAVQRVLLEIPVQDVADSCRTGAAINVIFGLALGYQSVIIPIFAIAVSIFVSFSFSAMCLLIGAMLPYWFSAMTLKSVGSAALKMVEEVRR